MSPIFADEAIQHHLSQQDALYESHQLDRVSQCFQFNALIKHYSKSMPMFQYLMKGIYYQHRGLP